MVALNRDKVRRVIAGVDWGFTNPGVILVFALDGDDRLYCVHQIYQTHKTIDWWIEQAKAVRDYYKPQTFVADPSEPAYIQQFRGAGISTTAGFNEVGPGIQAVQQRLVRAADGLPRLFFMRDSLVEADPSLVERKLPTAAEYEVDSYVWNLTGNRKKGEEPIKMHDHALDALRYVVCFVDGLGASFRAGSLAGAPRRAR